MTIERNTGWASHGTTCTPPPRRRDFLEEHFEDDTVLVHPHTGDSHRMNETALAVWKWCDGTSNTETMAARLTEAYELDSDRALDYVTELIALFAEVELLDVSGEP